MAALLLVPEIPHCNISEAINMYKEKTDRKTVKGRQKLLGVMKAKNIILHTAIIWWYLQHGFRLTLVHRLVEFERGNHFALFSEEVAYVRGEAHQDVFKKELNDFVKLNRNANRGRHEVINTMQGTNMNNKMIWTNKSLILCAGPGRFYLLPQCFI